ncbi:stage II sporulation protein M [Mycoplasmatota bacterium]|nr:stage II sporulation protein M [Mycoplasmatota bacterium]
MRHGVNKYYSYNQKDQSYQKKIVNKSVPYYLFTVILFIVGFISGNVVCYDLNNQKLLSVINPVKDTIEVLSVEKSLSLLIKSFFTHFTYIFIIWFLSLTIIGIILVMFIIFFVGFMYGVVISSFTYQLGFQGLLIGFFYTFPQNVILIPLLIYISSHSIRLSLAIFKNFFQSSSRKYLKDLLNQYYNQLFFATGILIIYALIMSIFGNVFTNILKSLI